ncbi:MAG: hypothetical protein ABEJ22_03170 [Haloferacaceae archaeon]
MAALAQQLEQYVSLGIFVVAATLAVLSLVAWRRERDRRMLVVTVAYTLFALRGLVVFLEYWLVALVPAANVELVEHASGILVLVGLLAFFLALARR